MAKGNWDQPIEPRQLLLFLKTHNGASLYEVKHFFRTNSKQTRIALGYLMFKEKLLVVAGNRGAIHLMLVTGERGRPNFRKARQPWEQAFREEQGLSTKANPKPGGKKKSRGGSDDEPEVEKPRHPTPVVRSSRRGMAYDDEGELAEHALGGGPDEDEPPW